MKVIRSAGETLEELSKEAPSEDRINSTATTFLKSLEVEFFLVYNFSLKYILNGKHTGVQPHPPFPQNFFEVIRHLP